MKSKYFNANKELWNKRTRVHVDSEFYDNDSFINGRSSLNSIELEELGVVDGKSLLHLQCHFGQDTLSWARLGAEVTGIDLSDDAINFAEKMAEDIGIDAKFICSNIYDLRDNLSGQFDIVFTSYGTIGWLPDIREWAKIVAHFLKPGGTFLIVDFHPYLWMYDDEFKKIQYSYFHENEPISEFVESTYTDKKDTADVASESYSWNHPLSDVTNSLIKAGLQIEHLNEYNYSPYNCFPNMIEAEEGKYVFEHFGKKVPHVFSIKAVKNR